MGWFSGNYTVKDKLVVISGGSQGLGAALARECVSRGADVFVVSRTESKLQQVVSDCKKLKIDSDQIVDYIVADISSQSECARVFKEVGETPDIVMCVAGMAIPGLLMDMDSSVFEKSIDSIYKSALYFSVEAQRVMAANPLDPEEQKANGKRHITLFSSVVAFYSFIGYGSYAPLKHAVRGLADVLRQECIPYDISVECVFPGNVATEGFEIEEQTKPEITRMIEGPSEPMDVQECAQLILARLDSGSQMVHTDLIGWVLNSIMMSGSPKTSGFFLVIVGFILTLISPILNWFINHQIKKYYNDKRSQQEKMKMEANGKKKLDNGQEETNKIKSL